MLTACTCPRCGHSIQHHESEAGGGGWTLSTLAVLAMAGMFVVGCLVAGVVIASEAAA